MTKKTIDQQTPGEVQHSYQAVFSDDSNNMIKDTLHHLEDIYLHTGIKSGFTVSVNADPTLIDIAAGEGIIVDRADSTNPVITRISFAGITGLSSAFLTKTINYIYIDNTGTPTVEENYPTRVDLKNRLFVGATQNNIVAEEFLFPLDNPLMAYGISITDLEDLVFGGGTTLSGGLITPASTDLSLDVAASILKQLGRNILIDPTSPNVVDAPARTPLPADRFFQIYINTLGVQVTDPPPPLFSDQLDVTRLNEGGLGTLVSTVNPNNFTIKRIFVTGTGSLVVYYGTKGFATLTDAMMIPETTWVEHEDTFLLSSLAKIIIKDNVVNLAAGIASGDAVIIPAFTRMDLK